MSSVAKLLHRHVGSIAIAAVLAVILGVHADATALDPPTPVVFIADGQSFADALVGGSLAASLNTSVLTVRGTRSGDSIPDATRDELARLQPVKIIVLGGPAAVSEAVLAELGTFTDPVGNVERIAGEDRYETAAKIAAALPSKVADADKLDGLDSSAFARTGHDHAQTVTRIFACSGADLRPFNSALQWRHAKTASLVVEGGSSDSNYACPLHLPDGARIASVVWFLHDDHSAGRFDFVSVDKSTRTGAGSFITAAAFVSNPFGGQNGPTPGPLTHSLGALDHTIDNATYSYLARVGYTQTAAYNPGSEEGLQIHGIEVVYQLDDHPRGAELD